MSERVLAARKMERAQKMKRGGEKRRERLHPQIRPLGVARFSDVDEMTTVENTQSKFGGRNTGGSKHDRSM